MANSKVPRRSLPAPLGSAPFHVKGHGLRARMDVYDRIVPGGRRAVLAAVDDEAVRDYLSGPILAASWYDCFAHAALDIAAADVRQMTAWDSVATASAQQAENDAKGIYSLLLKVVSPHVLVRKLGAISSQYFDYGTVAVEKVDTKAARMIRGAIPNQLYWWWGGISEGYVRALFKLAGAKNVDVRVSPHRTSAPEDPLGVGEFTVDATWE